MPDPTQFALFLVAAFVLAITPGPGIFLAFAASTIRDGATARPTSIRRLRQASGAAMIALGIGLAVAKRPAT